MMHKQLFEGPMIRLAAIDPEKDGAVAGLRLRNKLCAISTMQMLTEVSAKKNSTMINNLCYARSIYL